MLIDFDALAQEHVAAFVAGRMVDQQLFDAVRWAVSNRMRDEVHPALDARLRLMLTTAATADAAHPERDRSPAEASASRGTPDQWALRERGAPTLPEAGADHRGGGMGVQSLETLAPKPLMSARADFSRLSFD